VVELTLRKVRFGSEAEPQKRTLIDRIEKSALFQKPDPCSAAIKEEKLKIVVQLN